MDFSSVAHGPDLLKGIGIVLFTFASEDAATFTSAFLAVTRVISWPVAFTSCFLGIWLGDLGIYGLARVCGRPLAESLLKRAKSPSTYLEQSERWFTNRGLGALIICRFIPWSRLPTFLVAGLLRVSFVRFFVVTGVMALLWVALIYCLVAWVGKAAVRVWQHWEGGVFAVIGVVLIVAALLGIFLWLRKNLPQFLAQPSAQRYLRWEFWPGWLFYPPVVVHYFWLALKYRGLTLPTAANPCMPTGGLVGESKYDILRELFARHPDYVAEAFLLDATGSAARIAQLQEILALNHLTFPLAAKPDIGQRGVGFKILKDEAMARHYAESTPGRIVLQRYVPGPFELGIFYYRFPAEDRGQILAITDKLFPNVVGDGQRTLEELILLDPRASIVADTYLKRFDHYRSKVLEAGQVFRLVEAGNHAQGCIFQDGNYLQTPLLEQRIDEISRSWPGFFIGRYDVRYASGAELAQGRNFQIIELNGAAAEVTSIYDARNSLIKAYQTLFHQWDLVFAIGAKNRQRGFKPDSISVLWREWQKFACLSQGYPSAD